jgi:hypothetical protein
MKRLVKTYHLDQQNLDTRLKKHDFYDFKTDVLDQFSNLIEIENFGNKL